MEVALGLTGRSVECGPPARCEEENSIATVEALHAVRDHNDAASAVGDPAKKVHDVLLHSRVEARGWLVEEEKLRLREELKGDADPLPLSAGEAENTHLCAVG
jgi:hypothetical protein